MSDYDQDYWYSENDDLASIEYEETDSYYNDEFEPNQYEDFDSFFTENIVQDSSGQPLSRGKYAAKKAANHQNHFLTQKWYLSVPVILLTLFIYPVSIFLAILRVKDYKNQDYSYRRNSLLLAGAHIFLVLIIIISAISSSSWENSFEDAITNEDYILAYELLDDKYNSSISPESIEYYFYIFEASDDYTQAADILQKYYSNLKDKTQFDLGVRKKYQEAEIHIPPEINQKINHIFSLVDEAIQLKADEEKVALAEQSKKEEQKKAKAAEKEAEKEAAALAKAEKKRAAQLADARKAVDTYLDKSSAKNLKKVSKQDKTSVEEYLKEIISESLIYTPRDYYDAQKLQDRVDKLNNLYTDAFSEESPSITSLYTLSQKLVDEYKELDAIEEKYPFPLSSSSSYVWREFYITQRLEKSYSDNILGSIQKEIDSYSSTTTSDWVAYNVEYLPIIGASRGDDVSIIHSSELNPFPKTGVYNLLCYFGNDTTTLTDSQGFVFEAPVIYMISDDIQLYDDIETRNILNSNIKIIIDEIQHWNNQTTQSETVYPTIPTVFNPSNEPESAQTEPIKSAPTNPPTATQPTTSSQTMSLNKQGYVTESSGGLKIRSGPDTSYDEVGRLEPLAVITILETKYSGNREWGRIDRGWVCMDYVQLGTPPSYVATHQVGYIFGTTEGVNLRSGPGITYDSLGKVPPGKRVTVTKICDSDSYTWGFIGDGWVCTDYINWENSESDIGENVTPNDSFVIPAPNIVDKYVGHWGDMVSQRCTMQVEYHNDHFTFTLSWGNSASSTAKWEFTGWYDGYANAVTYSNGRHYTVEHLDSGEIKETVHYTNGSGYFYISYDGYMYWVDYTENTGANCTFQKH